MGKYGKIVGWELRLLPESALRIVVESLESTGKKDFEDFKSGQD
jgi:hypothetical protein